MATSMVKGNPVKLMLSFAFPLLIGNLLQQTYQPIDIVRHYLIIVSILRSTKFQFIDRCRNNSQRSK